MRNRYFDVVRAAAIVRVVVYHATGWAALTIVFPAMGVMFAMAGSLMAASLDRHGVRAVGRRIRRLLPPFWLVGAIFVPAMLLTGGLPVGWHLLRWLLPLQDPVANGWASSVLGVLWYIREYLWFVLLSPVALWLFRRWPVPTLAVPVALRVVLEFGPPVSGIIGDFALYFGCWLLGFAHHDNLLARVRPWVRAATAGALALAGAAWGLTHPGARPWDLNDIPLADALWSMSFVIMLIGFAPRDLAFIDQVPRLRRAVAVLNARAVTVYLWHQSAIVGTGALLGAAGIGLAGPGGVAWRLAGATVLIMVAVLAFGWVEDVAAQRRIRLLPGAGRPVPPAPPVATQTPAPPLLAVPAARTPVLAAAAVGARGPALSTGAGGLGVPTPRSRPHLPVGVPAHAARGAQWSGARDAYQALSRRRDRAARAETG